MSTLRPEVLIKKPDGAETHFDKTQHVVHRIKWPHSKEQVSFWWMFFRGSGRLCYEV